MTLYRNKSQNYLHICSDYQSVLQTFKLKDIQSDSIIYHLREKEDLVCRRGREEERMCVYLYKCSCMSTCVCIFTVLDFL